MAGLCLTARALPQTPGMVKIIAAEWQKLRILQYDCPQLGLGHMARYRRAPFAAIQPTSDKGTIAAFTRL
jgi:hypothetical protein